MMNVELLRRVQNQIRADEAHFSMSMWKRPSKCGTMFCVGGWAMVLSGVAEADVNGLGHDKAKTLLGLSESEADRLFYEENWPTRFQGEGGYCTPKQALGRIDFFIETGGTDGGEAMDVGDDDDAVLNELVKA